MTAGFRHSPLEESMPSNENTSFGAVMTCSSCWASDVASQIEEFSNMLIPTSTIEAKPATNHSRSSTFTNPESNTVLAAYQAASVAADEIAKRVLQVLPDDGNAKNIFLLHTKNKDGVMDYIVSDAGSRAFLEKCERLSTSIDVYTESLYYLQKRVVNQEITGVGAAPQGSAPKLVASIPDVAGALESEVPDLSDIPVDVIDFFVRLDHTVKQGTLDANLDAVQQRVTGKLIAGTKHVTVVSPTFMIVPETSNLLTKLSAILKRGRSRLNKFPIFSSFDEVLITPVLKGEIENLNEMRQNLAEEIATLATDAASIPTGCKLSLMTMLVIGEEVRALNADYYLKMDIVPSSCSAIAAAGTSSCQSPVRSGGVVVEFSLIGKDGTLQVTDLIINLRVDAVLLQVAGDDDDNRDDDNGHVIAY